VLPGMVCLTDRKIGASKRRYKITTLNVTTYAFSIPHIESGTVKAVGAPW